MQTIVAGERHGSLDPADTGVLKRISAWPRLASLGAGALAATGFVPLHWWPLALLAMGGFAFLLANTTDWRRAAWLGWLFGMGYFTLSNNWIATAFTHQSNMPAVLGWAAVPLLSVYLALFPALAAGTARAIAGAGRRWTMAPALGASWIIAEWMRGWVLTGYAWNPFGIVLLGPFDSAGLAAISPWTGTYALSGIAVLIAAGLTFALMERRFIAAGIAALLLAAGIYWPAGEGRTGTLDVTIVQPNLAQQQLNRPEFYEVNFERLAGLSLPRDRAATRLVLWPESGLADYLREGYPQRYYDATTAFGSAQFARRRLAGTIGPAGMLLTGAVDLHLEPDGSGDMRAAGAYNSVTAVDGQARLRGGYAKADLVPFGEFLPFRTLLEPIGLSRLVPGSMDFFPGPGPRTLDLGDQGRAAVQICYEIIFSGEVVDDGAARPDYIFNPSNDGWFGAFGPPQHLAQARLRAVEEGLPVLRATTTGISAVIDARGIVREYLPTGVAGRIDTLVPPAAPATLFARAGHWLTFGWALVLLCATGVALRSARR